MWKITGLKLSTGQLKDDLDPARLQVALPCNGNRRDESQHDSAFQRFQFEVRVVVAHHQERYIVRGLCQQMPRPGWYMSVKSDAA